MTALNNLYSLQSAQPAELIADGALDKDAGYDHYPPQSQSLAIARRVLGDLWTDTAGRWCLRYWAGLWWQYRAGVWGAVDSAVLARRIALRLEEVTTTDGRNGEPRPMNPRPEVVRSVMESLQTLVLVDPARQAPLWLNEDGEAKGRGPVVTMGNGLLDLATGKLSEHTPLWFDTGGLSFDYIPGASAPRWQTFLDEVFAHDLAGAAALQEYAGYLISGRLEKQKALIVIGPPRGGKGTISMVLRQLVGEHNHTAPSLTTLSKEFEATPLIGKTLAVVEDGRNALAGNAGAVDRILAIVGQDPITLQRKGKEPWEGVLPTRFVLFGNEVPRFPDASGAVAARFIGIRLVSSWQGQQDENLSRDLRAELPGIFNWALEGLERLNRAGRFTTPETHSEVIGSMKSQGSPVAMFLEDECFLTGEEDDYVSVGDLHAAYGRWCEVAGYKPVTQGSFREAVVSAGRGKVTSKQLRLHDGARPRVLTGVLLGT